MPFEFSDTGQYVEGQQSKSKTQPAVRLFNATIRVE